jgi:hypothetical protein
MTHVSLRLPLIAATLTLLLSFFLPFVSNAQTGVSITSALIEETLDPGFQTQYTITIENLDSIEQTYYLSTRDISDVKDGGVPVYAREGEEKTGMELSSWIVLNDQSLTLAGGESRTITIGLNVPPDASPGSHFGGVFMSVDPPEIENSGAAVGYQVANIISIRVSGEVNETASIRQFSTGKFLYGSKNIDFNVRIENSGNVLVRPTGPLEIFNMLGQRVDTVTFNENRNGVFPGVTREYKIDWSGAGTGFGRYEAVLSPVYGDEGAKKTMSSTVSFWVLPMSIIGPALIAFAVLFLIVFVSVRIYISRTVASLSQGRTRIVRSRRNNGPSPLLLFTVVMLVVTVVFLLILLVLFA